jgi:sulfate permease, SulP family
VVGYAESIAVAKTYARRNRYDVDPNQELVALGAANVAAGVFSGQPVTGGFSRTAVNASAGARTPLSSLVSAALIVIVLLVATGLFTELPQAVLGAIVIAAVSSLVDTHEMRHIVQVKRSDTLTMVIAFVATLLLGVELGLGVAVLASIAVVVTRLMNPHSAEVGQLPGTETYRNLQRFPEAIRRDGIGILRIDVSLNFANANFLKQRLRRLEADHPEGLVAIVLDGSGINDLDASAEATLSDLVTEYDERGIQVHLAAMKGPVRDVMIRSGLWGRLGSSRLHPSVHSAVAAVTDTTAAPRPDHRSSGVDERG